jgi:hypothetical protein
LSRPSLKAPVESRFALSFIAGDAIEFAVSLQI